MKKNALIMGMPVNIDIVDSTVTNYVFDEIFKYFHHIDDVFCMYKKTSEIGKINAGKIKPENYSEEMKKILKLAAQTNSETSGYFDIHINNKIDPSGIVKGFAIYEAVKRLKKNGYKNFYVEIGGDIQVYGKNDQKEKWKIGIKNPFNQKEIIKVVRVSNKGIATSGTYIRGRHINNPVLNQPADEIASVTVIGPNVYEADRFATAAFAMGGKGIVFIENLPGFEGYMIKKNKEAIFTSGFKNYL